jgi:hypothetical protein
MYTKGAGHQSPAKCLRDNVYGDGKGKQYPGFGFEDVLVNGGVSAYYCGHEHIFQHHLARGISHYVCGASGAEIRPGSGLYGGVQQSASIDWVATAAEYGFVVVTVTKDAIVTKFVNSDCAVIKEDTHLRTEADKHK